MTTSTGHSNYVVSDSDKHWLESMMTRLRDQDNGATAWPYYIAAQERTSIPTSTDYNYDEINYRTEDGDQADGPGDGILEYPVKHVYQDVNFFFTKVGYDNYVASNRHNLSHPRPYIKHAFRNQEFEKLFEILSNITGIKLPSR